MLTLVTGATGLVGNNVARALLERGEAVRVLTRPNSDERPFAGLILERAPGDVCDLESVRAACREVDRVVHCAARVHIGWTGLAEQQRTNVEGTRNVATAAREANAALAHVSSVDALGIGSRLKPANEESPLVGHVLCPYVVTKRAAEQVVLEQVDKGLRAYIVNPAYVLGPWDWKPSSGRMLLEVARGRGMLAAPGGNDFCDVRNVAAAILMTFERGQVGRRYILGGEPLSYLEAWRLFAEITGGRAPLMRVGPIALIAAGLAGSVWGKISGKEPDINLASTAVSRLEHHYSCERAIKELGYQPGTARAAATAAWEWFKTHGYAPGV